MSPQERYVYRSGQPMNTYCTFVFYAMERFMYSYRMYTGKVQILPQ